MGHKARDAGAWELQSYTMKITLSLHWCRTSWTFRIWMCLSAGSGSSTVVFLNLGCINQMHKYCLGKDWLGCSAADKDLGVTEDHKPTMSQQCALVANKRPTASWTVLKRDGSSALFGSGVVTLRELCLILGPSFQESQ